MHISAYQLCQAPVHRWGNVQRRLAWYARGFRLVRAERVARFAESHGAGSPGSPEGAPRTESGGSFEEQGGSTTMVSHELYPSKEALDAALSSGMEDGMRESFEQLDQLVASLRG